MDAVQLASSPSAARKRCHRASLATAPAARPGNDSTLPRGRLKHGLRAARSESGRTRLGYCTLRFALCSRGVGKGTATGAGLAGRAGNRVGPAHRGHQGGVAALGYRGQASTRVIGSRARGQSSAGHPAGTALATHPTSEDRHPGVYPCARLSDWTPNRLRVLRLGDEYHGAAAIACSV